MSAYILEHDTLTPTLFLCDCTCSAWCVSCPSPPPTVLCLVLFACANCSLLWILFFVYMRRSWAGWGSVLRISSGCAQPSAGAGRCELLWRSYCCRSLTCCCWTSRRTILTARPRYRVPVCVALQSHLRGHLLLSFLFDAHVWSQSRVRACRQIPVSMVVVLFLLGLCFVFGAS